jgi:hypothetical protein
MNPADNWRLIHFSDGEIRSVAKSDDMWALDSLGTGMTTTFTPVAFTVTATGVMALSADTLNLTATNPNAFALNLTATDRMLFTANGAAGSNPSIWIKATGGTNAGVRLESAGSVDLISANGMSISEAGGQAITITSAKTSGTGILLDASKNSNIVIRTYNGVTGTGTITMASNGLISISTGGTAGIAIQAAGTLQLQCVGAGGTGGVIIEAPSTSAVRIGTSTNLDIVKIHNEVINLEGGANGDIVQRVAGVWTHVTPAYMSNALTSAHILVGSVGNVATDVAMTGVIAITNAGVTSFASTITVAQGGTGLATLTAHALYVGNGTSAPTALAVGTNGQLLLGATTADPTWQTMSGSATITAAGVVALSTLVSAGSVGSESLVPVLTFNAEGRLTAGTSAQVLGTEVNYAEFVANVTIVATTSAGATQIVAVASGTYTARRYLFEFWCPDAAFTAAGELAIELWDNTAGTALGIIVLTRVAGAGEVSGALYGSRYMTVAAGTRVYSAKGWNVVGAASNAIVEAGNSGASTRYPGYLRISLA